LIISFETWQLRIGLEQDGFASVDATFEVPVGTQVGTADGIVVTVTSQLDGTQNYARTTLVVISDVRKMALWVFPKHIFPPKNWGFG